MITSTAYTILREIRQHALELGDDEIALDCDAAMRGSRDALGYVRITCKRRKDYADWADGIN